MIVIRLDWSGACRSGTVSRLQGEPNGHRNIWRLCSDLQGRFCGWLERPRLFCKLLRGRIRRRPTYKNVSVQANGALIETAFQDIVVAKCTPLRMGSLTSIKGLLLEPVPIRCLTSSTAGSSFLAPPGIFFVDAGPDAWFFDSQTQSQSPVFRRPMNRSDYSFVLLLGRFSTSRILKGRTVLSSARQRFSMWPRCSQCLLTQQNPACRALDL